MITLKHNKSNLMIFTLVLISLLSILISISSVSATSTVYVNTTGNDINGNGSADNPYLTIGKGISSVDSNGTINIANGQYTGVGNTNITISKNMTITGQSQSGTIINGTGTNWIFHINSGLNVVIQDLTIVNGNATYGGAIENDAGSALTVNNCTFTGNKATNGGAIGNHGDTLTVNNCTFTGNKANYGGGAIDGTLLTVNNCTFAGNNASTEGGAIQSWNTLIVTDSTFTGNYAGLYGGAILNWLNCNMTNCTFTINKANYEGGAIYNNNEGILNVTGSTFTGNNATSDGGAIFNGGTSNINGCTFTGNEATYGGVFHNDGTLTVSGCTFNGNSGGQGGAVHNDGPLTVNGCIFTNNHSNGISDPEYGDFGGGAIYVDEHNCTITGCNFYQNTAENHGGAIYIGDWFVTHGGGVINIKYGQFVGNSASAGQDIWISYPARNLVNATLNWWGSNNGPIVNVGPAVDRIKIDDYDVPDSIYAPYLIMRINGDPSSIHTGQTSTITANVYMDSNGTDHSTDAAQFFSGPEVTFRSNLGTIGSYTKTVDWILGQAVRTYHALTAGEDPITATDGPTVTTTLTILQTPVTPTNPVTQSGNDVKATTITEKEGTIGMQETGLPLAPLALAVLTVLGGLAGTRRK